MNTMHQVLVERSADVNSTVHKAVNIAEWEGTRSEPS